MFDDSNNILLFFVLYRKLFRMPLMREDFRLCDYVICHHVICLLSILRPLSSCMETNFNLEVCSYRTYSSLCVRTVSDLSNVLTLSLR